MTKGTDFPFTPDQLRNASNDSGMTVEQVVERLGKDGVKINYGKFGIFVERSAIDKVEQRIKTELNTPEGRYHELAYTDRRLRRNVPKIRKGTASKKVCDDTHWDLIIWHVLRSMMT